MKRARNAVSDFVASLSDNGEKRLPDTQQGEITPETLVADAV